MKKHIVAISMLSAALTIPAISMAANKATTAATNAVAATQPQTQKVNINTANLASFETIKGLGAKKSQAIITYRDAHGKFKSIDDLKNVPGISNKLLAKIKDQLTLG